MTRNVSTFELLVKRIAPPVGFVQPAARRIAQGYFLTVTNLTAQRIFFGIEFFNNPTVNNDRRLIPTGNLQNVERLADFQDNDNVDLSTTDIWSVFLAPLQGDANAYFAIDAGGTASVQLLPRLTPLLLTTQNPALEIRGYVRIKVPFFNFFSGFKAPQNGGDKVKVLLQPEIRGTFLPNEFPIGTEDFDQINYTLLTASGQAFNEITPEIPSFAKLKSLQKLPKLSERLEKAVKTGKLDEINGVIAELETNDAGKKQMFELVQALKSVEPDSENLREVSGMLEKLGVPIELTPARR